MTAQLSALYLTSVTGSAELGALCVTAVLVGFVHCVFGPDHYVPFVAMSRVGKWSLRKTLVVTILCGIGHVGSSALLGFIGIACGLIVFQLRQAEAARGNVAAWLLLGFGMAYTIWGLWRAWRPRHPHAGVSAAGDQVNSVWAASSLTPWILFTVFVFGPCEPLIPLLMYPAAQANAWNVVLVTVLFGMVTLVTMTAFVVLGYAGVLALQGPKLERFGHCLAGLTVTLCGVVIVWQSYLE